MLFFFSLSLCLLYALGSAWHEWWLRVRVKGGTHVHFSFGLTWICGSSSLSSVFDILHQQQFVACQIQVSNLRQPFNFNFVSLLSPDAAALFAPFSISLHLHFHLHLLASVTICLLLCLGRCSVVEFSWAIITSASTCVSVCCQDYANTFHIGNLMSFTKFKNNNSICCFALFVWCKKANERGRRERNLYFGIYIEINMNNCG